METVMILGCRKFAHSQDYTMGLHCHTEGQFFMLLHGTAIYSTDRGEWLLTSRYPCWVPPHTAHGVRSRGKIEGVVVMASKEMCEFLPDTVTLIKTNNLIEALLDKMARTSDNTATIQHLWAVLKDELLSAEQEDLHLPVPIDERLRLLTQMLVDDPTDARSLAQWAEKISLSHRTLIRKFRAETGMSFVAWRQRARVIQAIKLLSLGQSVTEVALAVGYESLSAFISVFKQITGVAPAQYLSTVIRKPAGLS